MIKMKRKIGFLVLFSFLFLFNFTFNTFALEKNDKKMIIISLNRFSFDDLSKNSFLKEKLKKEGYLALMNIRGSKGTSDIRNYASMAYGGRVYINNDNVDIKTITDENKEIYLRRTGIEGKKINNLKIEALKKEMKRSEYSYQIGYLADTLNSNNIEFRVYGNENTDEKNKLAHLFLMDGNGQIQDGYIDNINIIDKNRPYSIKDNYEFILKDLKQNQKNLSYIVLGDTYRLEKYKENLSEFKYEELKEQIDKELSAFLKQIFNEFEDESQIMIISPYPKIEDYRNFYRLSFLSVFKDGKKGLIKTSTTRRNGIIANIDISEGILDYFNISSEKLYGRKFDFIEYENNYEFLKDEYLQIATVYKSRSAILYNYAFLEMFIWVFSLILFFKLKKKNKIIKNAISFSLILTLVMPITLLFLPLIKFKTDVGLISTSIIISLIILLILRFFTSDNIKIIKILSFIMSISILIDTLFGQYLIKRSILGYDAMIGARYYGVGNEYMGILIGSTILFISMIFKENKINKLLMVLFLGFSILILGFPKMGANVGGTITAICAFIFLSLRIFRIKIDFKKIIYIGFSVILVVFIFACIDIFILESKSHLGKAVLEIKDNGMISVIQIITRKISMNIHLIKVSVWSKVFMCAMAIFGYYFFKPSKFLKELKLENKNIYFGFESIVVGSFVGFFVNDSGVVAAATSMCYIIVPFLIIFFDFKKLK